jgi:MFS family permease
MLIGVIGWRVCWVWQGVFVWVLVVPIAGFLVVNKPEDLGVLPDGDSDSPQDQANGGSAVSELEDSFTVLEALRTVTFWVMAVGIAIPAMLITGMIFHQISYFEGQGLTAQDAANIFPILSVTMVIFMLIYGQLLDRVRTSYVVAGGILMNAVALWLLYIADTTFLAGLYGASIGATTAATMTNASYVWPRYFGRKHLGGIQGAAFTITIVGAAIGPMPFGIAYDLQGGYHEAVLWLSLLPVIFGLAVMITRPPVRTATQEKQDQK